MSQIASSFEDCRTYLLNSGVDTAVCDVLHTIELNEKEAAFIEGELASREADNAAFMESRRAALTEAIAAATARLARLTDLLLDGKIDSPPTTSAGPESSWSVRNSIGRSRISPATPTRLHGVGNARVFLARAVRDDLETEIVVLIGTRLGLSTGIGLLRTSCYDSSPPVLPRSWMHSSIASRPKKSRNRRLRLVETRIENPPNGGFSALRQCPLHRLYRFCTDIHHITVRQRSPMSPLIPNVRPCT